MTSSAMDRPEVLALLAFGVFFLFAAAVLRWSSHRFAILRDDETDLREYFADECPWMPQEEAATESGLQVGDGVGALRGVHTSDSDVSPAGSLQGMQAKGAQTL